MDSLFSEVGHRSLASSLYRAKQDLAAAFIALPPILMLYPGIFSEPGPFRTDVIPFDHVESICRDVGLFPTGRT